MAETSKEFDQAAIDVKNLKGKPSDNELLELYALFKQATQNPPFEEASKPGMFDLKGKAKHSAWEKIVKEDVSPSDAQTKYIALVQKMKEKHGFDG